MNLNLFPTTIQYYEKLLDQKKCEELVYALKNYKLKPHDSFTDNAVSNHEGHENTLHKFPKLEKFLNEKIANYSNELGLHTIKITSSWVNFQFEKSKLKEHVHPGSQISGVLFLKTDNKSSKIYFYNPNPYNKFLITKKSNHNNFDHVSINPNIGDLILFPSWLSHGSHEDTNMSLERVALSFNT